MGRPTSGFRLTEVLRLPRRSVHVLEGASPAVFLLVDDRAGAILVNAPPFSEETLSEIRRAADPSFIFLPSRFGARDLELWRAATRARTIASAEEVPAIEGRIDEPIDGSVRMHGRLDFLLLSGRTRGTCALRVKEPPGIVFFGPALEHAGAGRFVLRAHRDDHSFENRVIGALAFRDLEFEFAFCDDYIQNKDRGGPGARLRVRAAVDAALEGSG